MWCGVRAVAALSALTQSQEASTDTIVIVIDDALFNTASAGLIPGLTASIGIKPVYWLPAARLLSTSLLVLQLFGIAKAFFNSFKFLNSVEPMYHISKYFLKVWIIKKHK